MAQVLTAGVSLREGEIATLNLLNGVGDAPASFHLMLYLDSLAPTRDTAYAAFDAAKATFDGYSAQAVTFAGPMIDSGDQAILVGSNELFVCTGSTTSDSIGGVMLYQTVTGTPNVLTALRYWPFENSVIIGQTGRAVGAKPLIQLPFEPGQLVLEV